MIQLEKFEEKLLLKDPPAIGEPTIRYRDFDGVNGSQVAWAPTNGQWEYTGVVLQNIPPKEGEPTTKTNNVGEIFTWSEKRQMWYDRND